MLSDFTTDFIKLCRNGHNYHTFASEQEFWELISRATEAGDGRALARNAQIEIRALSTVDKVRLALSPHEWKFYISDHLVGNEQYVKRRVSTSVSASSAPADAIEHSEEFLNLCSTVSALHLRLNDLVGIIARMEKSVHSLERKIKDAVPYPYSAPVAPLVFSRPAGAPSAYPEPEIKRTLVPANNGGNKVTLKA